MMLATQSIVCRLSPPLESCMRQADVQRISRPLCSLRLESFLFCRENFQWQPQDWSNRLWR